MLYSRVVRLLRITIDKTIKIDIINIKTGLGADRLALAGQTCRARLALSTPRFFSA